MATNRDRGRQMGPTTATHGEDWTAREKLEGLWVSTLTKAGAVSGLYSVGRPRARAESHS